MSFYDWMMQYKEHNTPRGNLADDMIRSESGFPKDGSFEEIETYLKSHGACSQSLEILKSVWDSYKKETGA